MAQDNKWAFGKYEATLIRQHIKCILNILNVNPTIIRHKNYIHTLNLFAEILRQCPHKRKFTLKKHPSPNFEKEKRKYLGV